MDPLDALLGEDPRHALVMLPYFGELWDMPYLDGKRDMLHQVPTPVGQLCMWCIEEIVEGDRGLIQPVVTGREMAELRPAHAECNLRSLLGSPQHLRQQCNCYHDGAAEDDGRPWREQARETVAIINAERACAGYGPLW